MATFSITISASAVDSALTDEVVRVSTLSVGSTVNAAIFAADSGSGADVWASSDEAGSSQIGLKLVHWSDADSEFAVDIAGASLSAVSDTVVYLQVGSNPGASDPYPASAELVAPLISDFNDLTSNGNNGTGNGGITAGGVTGPDGVLAATNFDGTDDNISLGDTADVDFGAGNFTLSLWAKLGSLTQNRGMLIAKDASGQRQFALEWDPTNDNSNRIRIGYYVGGVAAKEDTSTNIIADTNWHHLAFGRVGNDFFGFIDGAVITLGESAGLHGAMSATTANLKIGSRDFAGFNDPINASMCGIVGAATARSAASINFQFLLEGPNAATYITAAEVGGGGGSNIPAIMHHRRQLTRAA